MFSLWVDLEVTCSKSIHVLKYYIDTDAGGVVYSKFKCTDMHACVLYFTNNLFFVMNSVHILSVDFYIIDSWLFV